MSTWPVLRETAAERLRQDARFGEQGHPDGTGGPFSANAEVFRASCDVKTAWGVVTWTDILLEEVYEALAESEPAKLRAELIQVAAVAVCWVEAIDRRERTSDSGE